MSSDLWTPEPTAMALLESSGNPFDTNAYREAFIAGYPRWREASFGAVGADGTRAAIALLAIEAQAECVPLGYGGIVSDRPLQDAEAAGFLEAARATAGVRTLRVRSIPALGGASLGVEADTTSVVDLCAPDDYHRQAQRSLRTARESGATVGSGVDPAGFSSVYFGHAKGQTYDAAMIRSLAAAGVCRFTDVVLDGSVVATVAVLTGTGHWMSWLAAQTPEGARIEAGYLARDAVIAEARRAGARWLNLGTSTITAGRLEGVVQFKRSLGGADRPVFELEISAGRWRRRARPRSVRP